MTDQPRTGGGEEGFDSVSQRAAAVGTGRSERGAATARGGGYCLQLSLLCGKSRQAEQEKGDYLPLPTPSPPSSPEPLTLLDNGFNIQAVTAHRPHSQRRLWLYVSNHCFYRPTTQWGRRMERISWKLKSTEIYTTTYLCISPCVDLCGKQKSHNGFWLCSKRVKVHDLQYIFTSRLFDG